MKEILKTWFGHVMQMGNDRISKKMIYTKMQEKRPRGKPEPDG